MNISPAGLIAAGILACTGVTQAVVITANTQSYSTTVTLNSGTTTDNTPPTNQTFPNSGTISSTGIASTQSSLGPGSWQFNGLNLASVAASRSGGAGNDPVTVAASAVHTIAFTLGVGESALVTLNMNYSLAEAGGHNATLGWSFTGPGGTVSGISGNMTTAATNTSIAQQQVNIATAGTYTFTLTSALPSAAITKSSSASAAVNSFDLDINMVTVPEPASAMLGSLGVGLLMFRRRRIPS